MLSIASLIKSLLLLNLVAIPSKALSIPSFSRRAFLTKAVATVTLIPPIAAANAYGEFEPGAKARKKAAQDKKSAIKVTSSSSPSSAPNAADKPEDLKAALGDFSYGTTTPSKKK